MKTNFSHPSTALLAALAIFSGVALAKLPAPPPVDPVKAEEAKAKAAETAKAGAALQAKYEDKAVANYATKLKAEGKELKPYVAPEAAAPAAATAAPAAVAAPAAAGPAAAAGAPKK